MSDWVIECNSNEEVYKSGDLVNYYEFERFHYGEGMLRSSGTGIVLGSEEVKWCSEAQAWVDAVYNKPYVVVQYRVYCFETQNIRYFGARGLTLLALGAGWENNNKEK